jgi:hypothetical protein
MYDDSESPNWAPLRRRPFPILGAGQPVAPSTRVVVADGVTWRVGEREAPETIQASCTRCLYFESAAGTRRVCEYPVHWYALPDAELHALGSRQQPR